ncbi:MAG: DUF72 domain-containing protein [Planctomycetota bacterium]
MLSSESPKLPIRIGCPVWNCDGWSEIVYPTRTAKADRLNWYTRMFSTVEGNNSFYAIPAEEHARRWGREAADGFQFCMKFPREISHERGLLGAERSTEDFLRILYILAEAGKAGPAFLQLGPDFCARRTGVLERYLKTLPGDLDFAVEVRHSDWFDSAENENLLIDMLSENGMDQTLFDSRPLYQADPDDEIEKVSQTRKPKSPLRKNVTGSRPMLRLVGRNRVEMTHKFIDEWIPTVAEWVAEGLEPIVFTHAPDDTFAPKFAREFWSRLASHLNARQNVANENILCPSELPSLPKKPQQMGFAFE